MISIPTTQEQKKKKMVWFSFLNINETLAVIIAECVTNKYI